MPSLALYMLSVFLISVTIWSLIFFICIISVHLLAYDFSGKNVMHLWEVPLSYNIENGTCLKRGGWYTPCTLCLTRWWWRKCNFSPGLIDYNVKKIMAIYPRPHHHLVQSTFTFNQYDTIILLLWMWMFLLDNVLQNNWPHLRRIQLFKSMKVILPVFPLPTIQKSAVINALV